MFYKNDYVNYSTYGICKIQDIRFMKFSISPDRRKYYILKPVDQEKASLFVPVDNQRLAARMKRVLSPKEIDDIILSIKNKKLLWVNDRKQREKQFQEILLRRDERELLLMIGCLYVKSKESEKGISSTDMQILKKAEHIIEQEFAFSLQISTKSIRNYIREKLDLAEFYNT